MNLNQLLGLFWVMDAFADMIKATVDSVQKLYPDSCLCQDPQGSSMGPDKEANTASTGNTILIALPMLIVTMPSKINSKHPKEYIEGVVGKCSFIYHKNITV